ncbi:MAG: hypothetical protein AAGD25_14280 [Cyanobacteria bacterium P01_F01_bin.150]
MHRLRWSALFAIALSGCLTACGEQPQVTLPSTEPAPEEPTWAFTPEPDTYDRNALLDLRFLNEDIAGQTGFIRRSEDGKDFVKGDGSPIRFWAVNSEVWEKSPDELDNHAKFLAKRGVNLVRWHGNIPADKKDGEANLSDISEEDRDNLWRYVAAMKQEGIYMTLSPYYALWMKPRLHWDLPRSGNGDMHGLLFFDPELQEAYKGWLRELLEPINPYTGIALKDDPAIAIFQLQNEDSLLFWTVENIQGYDLALLREQFGKWAIQKYGSVDNAFSAWKNTKINDKNGDQLEQGWLGLYPLWELTKEVRNPNSGKAKRLADQTEFLTETMRAFNAEMVRFLRDDIGTPALINAGNWKTAEPRRLNDAERYSYTPSDIIGVNRYYTTVHEGDAEGWAITKGDRFTDDSVLIRPWEFPLNLKQVENYPMIVPESSWVSPLSYQSEGPFLVSTFQSLTGIDAFYWFTTPDPQWRTPSSPNGRFPSIGKWMMNTPELLGNFPAAALMYRKGYLQLGDAVVNEVRTTEQLWQRQAPLISETQSFDPNRDTAFVQNQASDAAGVHPLAFLAGPIQVAYEASSASNNPGGTIANLEDYIDPEQKIIQSVTGEITWDYGNGLCWIDAPQAQGVTGFLSKQDVINLSDISLASDNYYGTLWAISLDEDPIAVSKRILVQVGTRTRPKSWETRVTKWTDKDEQTHTGFIVMNYGEEPWQVVEPHMELEVRNQGINRAIALDMNGMAIRDLPLETTDTGVTVVLPTDAKYLILEK